MTCKTEPVLGEVDFVELGIKLCGKEMDVLVGEKCFENSGYMSHLQICTKKAKERLLKRDGNETDLEQWLGCVKANKSSQVPFQEILCGETHKDRGLREH